MEKMSTTEIKLQRQSVQLTKGENQVSNSENMAPLSQYLQPLCLYQINCLVRQRRKDSDRAFCSQIRLNSNSHEPYCESKSPYSSKSERTMAEQKEDDPSELIYRPNTRRRHQKSPSHLNRPLNRAINDRNVLSIFDQEKKEPFRNAQCRLDRYIFTRPEIQLENPANITLPS